MTMTVLWLIVVAVMLVIEIFTMGLTTIWFSIGAVAAAVASGFSAPVWLQIVLFAAVSVLVMLLVRPFAMKVMDSGKMKTNLDEIAGQKVRVLEEINNSEGTGKVDVPRCGMDGKKCGRRSDGQGFHSDSAEHFRCETNGNKVGRDRRKRFRNGGLYGNRINDHYYLCHFIYCVVAFGILHQDRTTGTRIHCRETGWISGNLECRNSF